MANPRFSPEAQEDLTDIWLWGAEKFGEAQADIYYSALFDTAETIAAMPLMGSRPLADMPDARIHPSGSHVILYRVGEDQSVDILRILSMRQDWLATPRNWSS